MKKTFRLTRVAASVGALLFVGSASVMAAGVGTTNLIFPYVKSDPNAYTFISIVNPGYTPTAGNANGGYHFSYGMKLVTAPNFDPAGGTDACEHADGRARTTSTDLMQFEMSNRINLPAAFGDTTSVPYYYNGTTATHGFLIVNTNHDGLGGAGAAAYTGQRIYGEAVVIDVATGLRVSYTTNDLNTDNAANPDFTVNNVGVTGGPITVTTQNTDGVGSLNGVNVLNWMQTPTVATSWYVAPLGLRSEMTPSGNGGLYAVYRALNTTYTDFGAYDNNEQFHSGAHNTTVRCLGLITRNNMLNSSPLNNTVNGGWTKMSTSNSNVAGGEGDVVNGAGNGLGTSGIAKNKSLIYKIQSTTALGSAMTFVSREQDF